MIRYETDNYVLYFNDIDHQRVKYIRFYISRVERAVVLAGDIRLNKTTFKIWRKND